MPTVIRQDTPFLVWRLLHCGLRFFLRLLTSTEVKRLHDDMLESRVLDTSTLNSADNPLGSLWLSTEGLTKRYLAGQVARKHEPSLMHNPANGLALRLRAFCIKLREKYLDNSRPAPLDLYVLASSSVKVGNHTYSALIVTCTVKPGVLLQLIWKSSADESLKACTSGSIVVSMCLSAAEICQVVALCNMVLKTCCT